MSMAPLPPYRSHSGWRKQPGGGAPCCVLSASQAHHLKPKHAPYTRQFYSYITAVAPAFFPLERRHLTGQELPNGWPTGMDPWTRLMSSTASHSLSEPLPAQPHLRISHQCTRGQSMGGMLRLIPRGQKESPGTVRYSLPTLAWRGKGTLSSSLIPAPSSPADTEQQGLLWHLQEDRSHGDAPCNINACAFGTLGLLAEKPFQWLRRCTYFP